MSVSICSILYKFKYLLYTSKVKENKYKFKINEMTYLCVILLYNCILLTKKLTMKTINRKKLYLLVTVSRSMHGIFC